MLTVAHRMFILTNFALETDGKHKKFTFEANYSQPLSIIYPECNLGSPRREKGKKWRPIYVLIPQTHRHVF